jgi:hypothetical protein
MAGYDTLTDRAMRCQAAPTRTSLRESGEMSTDALVLDQPGPSVTMANVPISSITVINRHPFNAFQELYRLHLPAGRSYVVFARGHIHAQLVSFVDLRLEAHDAVEEMRFQNLGPNRVGDPRVFPLAPEDPQVIFPQKATFSLAVTTTLPNDEDLFVLATLSGRISIQVKASDLLPHHHATDPGEAHLRHVKIIALAVDSLSVNPD